MYNSATFEIRTCIYNSATYLVWFVLFFGLQANEVVKANNLSDKVIVLHGRVEVCFSAAGNIHELHAYFELWRHDNLLQVEVEGNNNCKKICKNLPYFVAKNDPDPVYLSKEKKKGSRSWLLTVEPSSSKASNNTRYAIWTGFSYKDLSNLKVQVVRISAHLY